jgi:hypothetical protein
MALLSQIYIRRMNTMNNNIDIIYRITPCITDYKPIDYLNISAYEIFWLKLQKTFYKEIDSEDTRILDRSE